MKTDFNLKRSLFVLLTLFVALAGGGSSAWADELTEGFESVTRVDAQGDPVASYSLAPKLSNGWICVNSSGEASSQIYTSDSYSYYIWSKGKTGSKSLAGIASSSNSYYIVIPTELTGDISFSICCTSTSTSTTGYVEVYQVTDDGDGTYTIGSRLQQYTKSGNSSYTWADKVLSLGEAHKLIAFKIWRAAIDDFSATIYEEGGIKKPTNVAYSNLVYNGATISWSKGDEADAEWQVAYGAAGFDVASEGTKEVVNTTSYNISGLTEHTAYDVYVRTKNGDDYSGWTAKVNFTTPYQYPAPTTLAASGETTTTATLSWTAGSTETAWELSYSVNSDFSESTEVDVTTSPTKGLTGLNANTTYYVKVRANYGDSHYSAWTEAITFKTLQVATSAANYSDDFESANNWTLINGTQTNAWAWGTAAKNGGSKGLYISNDGGTTNAYGTGATIVYASQLFSFAAGDYVVSYDWLCKGETGYSSHYDYIRVALVPVATELSAGTSAPSGFSSSALPSGWIALDGGSALLNVTAWQNKSVNVNIPSNANYQVVFAWTNDGSGGTNPPAAIDNFAIRLNDTPNPTSLAVTDITAHAGTLGWTTTDNTWEVYHSTSSTAPAANQEPTASPNTNSYTFTGLDAETKYYVWVRSVSKTNASWKSDWVGTNFTTDIAAVAPTGLAAGSITATGATLSWTAGADETKWDIVYGTVNDATSLSNTSEEISTTPSKALTGLTANTKYYFFVRAKKGEEVSSWVSTNFTTTFGVPFTETFGSSSMPTGWVKYSGNMDNVLAGTATLTTDAGNWNIANRGISGYHPVLNLYSAYSGWIVTPTIELTTNNEVSFKLAYSKYNSTNAATDGTNNRFAVLITTDNGENWTKLAEWNNSGSSRVLSDVSASGDDVSINLSTYNNSTVKIAFYAENSASGGDNDIHIDDVSVDVAPAVVKPTGLTASNSTTTSVQLSWTSDGEKWDVHYRETGEGDWTTVNNITTNPYTLTGLNNSTTYEVQVRTVGASESSEWSNSATFTTSIAVDAEHPFTENFSSGIPSSWTINTVSGTAWSAVDNKARSGYTANAYLILPKIAVTEGMYLAFDQSYTWPEDYDESSVAISTTGTAAGDFTTIWTEEKVNASTSTTSKTISLEAYAGQNVYIAFKFNGSSAHYWYVDNVMVGMSATANETANNTFTAGTYAAVNVTYTKDAEKWGTLCLPFATTTTELSDLYGTTVKAYELTSFASNTIAFSSVTDLATGKPYLIYSEGAMSGAKTFTNKEITATTAGSNTEDGVTFVGTYAPIAVGNMPSGSYGVTSTGEIRKAGSGASLKGFRAYFTGVPAAATARIAIVDETTGIKNLTPALSEGEGVYNLQGQKVENLKKGNLYIKNGKKVIMK